MLAATALVAVAASVWWLAPGGVATVSERYPRIVLVTFDTLHVLHTGVFNPEVDYTPEIDRLAAAGTLFAQARTTVPMTLPSHTSMLSGRTPLGLGLLRNGERVDPAVRTLPQILAEAGYRTAAFVSLATLRKEYQLDRGFETYDDGWEQSPRFYRTADEVLAAAEPWLRAHQQEPYFVWVHLSDPHEPYGLKGAEPDVRIDFDGAEVARVNLTGKETHAVDLELTPGKHVLRWTSLRVPAEDDLVETGLFLRFRKNDSLVGYLADWEALPRPDADLSEPFEIELIRRPEQPAGLTVRFDGGLRKPPRSVVGTHYPLEVAYADRHLGELRRLVDGDQAALWIVASDHGEGLYRHGDIIGHAGFGREDQLRILWAMAGPGVPVGKRVEEVALAHDLTPTVLDLIGLPGLDGVEGQSLVECMVGSECPETRQWFAHGFSRNFDGVSAVAVYRWPWKALQQRGGGSGVYDLGVDPWEREPRPDDLPDRGDELEVRRLRRELQEVRALVERRLAEGGGDLSEDELEMLRSLGYLGN